MSPDEEFVIAPYMKVLNAFLQILEPESYKRHEGIFAFKIVKPNGKIGIWTINLLAKPKPKVEFNSKVVPDATFTLKEEHWLNLVKGLLNPQRLLLNGRIKVEGNTGVALRLGQFQVELWRGLEELISKL